MNEELAEFKSKPKRKEGSRTPLTLAVLAAVAFAVWCLVEHRRAEIQTQIATTAEARVATLEKQMAATQQQLTVTAAKLNEIAAKNLPVSVVFRTAKSGNGITTFFKNNSSAPIDVSLVLTDPLTGRRREANQIIQGNGILEIGESQGWTFAPGHRIQLTNAQYGTIEYVVPAN